MKKIRYNFKGYEDKKITVQNTGRTNSPKRTATTHWIVYSSISNKTISFDVRNKIKDFSNDPINELITFDIYFMNISSSLYHFHKSLKNHVNSSGDPFSQPTQVYSNINNGIGVFAGASPFKISLF